MRDPSRWFVYVVRCADDSLYTGVARDVEARIAQHEEGKGARYTRGRAPFSLAAKVRCRSQGDALRVEYAFKALSRGRKLELTARPRGLANFARRVRVVMSAAQK